MNTLHKIFIGVLLASIAFSIVMLCIDTQRDNSYMYICSIIGATMVIVGLWQKSRLDKLPFSFQEPNGESPSSLGTFLGIGHVIMGALKYREIEDTYVSYTFFSFVLPLFPTGCYRVKLLDASGGTSFHTQKWAIYGSEEMKISEILNVYLLYVGSLMWLLFLIFALVF